jgi:hypothetical protein
MAQYEFWILRGQSGWFYSLGSGILNWEESKFGSAEIGISGGRNLEWDEGY